MPKLTVSPRASPLVHYPMVTAPSHSKLKAWRSLLLPLRNEDRGERREGVLESAQLDTNRDSSNNQFSFNFYRPDPSHEIKIQGLDN